MLIVKYAIDAGLMRIFTPSVRVVCGFLFGTGLIAAAEIALRNEDRVDDPRVRQALAGAGIATIYAAFLIAANVYQLIDPLTGFIGLALTTAGALALSTRFGAPSALLGLAGGLAAPAMISGIDTNVSMLAVYLALTIAGLAGVSRTQRWPWLGLAALVGGAGWSLWLILATQALDTMATLSVGGYVILLAIALPLLIATGPYAKLVRAVSAIIGALQLALMVAIGGFALLTWGQFILLAAAAQWLAHRDERLSIVPSVSLPLSAILLAIWPQPDITAFVGVGLALAVIHGGPLLAKLWRTPPLVQRTLEFCGLALGLFLVPVIQFYATGDDATFAWIAFAASVVPALGIATGWAKPDRKDDARFVLLTGTTALLLGFALLLALLHWLWPIGIGALAAALLLFGAKANDHRIEPVAGVFAVATMIGLFAQASDAGEGLRLITGIAAVDLQAVSRWGGVAALAALFAHRARNPDLRTTTFGLGGLLAYGTSAQLVAAWALPLTMALVAAAMVMLAAQRRSSAETRQAAVYAGLAVALLAITNVDVPHEWLRLVAVDDAPFDPLSVLRWGGLAALGTVFALRARVPLIAQGAQIATALLGYGTAAQIVPADALPLVAPVALVALAGLGRQTGAMRMMPAAATLLALVGCWAALPVGLWGRDALLSLGGIPMTIDESLMPIGVIVRQLLAPVALLAAALLIGRDQLRRADWLLTATATALIGGIGLHALYRVGFAQLIGSDFASFGVAQRLVWDVLLIGGAALMAPRAPQRPLAIMLAAAGTLHAFWYGLVLHNPLWAEQAVGTVPLLNLIVPLFAVPLLGLVQLRALFPDWKAVSERPFQMVLMAMVAGLGWALLRQSFHGALLVDPGVFAAEDILRSILAIMLAVGYLLWGIRSQQRDWRIASLFLILAAVAKVFLLDASGLEGLMRIGSFVALGFSLIGIGWLYSRQLKADAATVTE